MLARLKRRLLLAMLSRQRPGQLLDRGRAKLFRALASAAKRSSAYAQILRESGVTIDELRTEGDLARAPVLSKENTFERFPIEELLARDVRREALAGVLTSSGYGAVSFGFGISDRREKAFTPEAIDLGLQNAFGVDDRQTLLINTLPMGVIFESGATCVSNVSVREDMAFAILRQAGPLFDQVVLVTDPLFCKRFLDYGKRQSYEFSQQRIQMVIGEETFQEPFRDYLRESLGHSGTGDDAPFLGSSMGVGELGLNLFFETPETVALRRCLAGIDPWRRQPMLFCFNPLRSWVEVHNPDSSGVGDLLITMQDTRSTVPLPRYRTGDRATWLADLDLTGVPQEIADRVRNLPFPVIAVHGRDRDQLSDDWHVDDFKLIQYRDSAIADCLSAAFRVGFDRTGRLHWHLQAIPDCPVPVEEISAGLRASFQRHCDALAIDAQVLAELRVFPYGEFPYGMRLDYERKFRYVGAFTGAPAH